MAEALFEKVLSNINSIQDSVAFIDYATKIANEYELQTSHITQRENGSYFTHFSLARDIVRKVICENNTVADKLRSSYFLEPCVGTGNFVFAYLEYLSSLNLSRSEILSAINRIYVADNDKDVLEIYKLLFGRYVELLFGIILPNDYFADKVGFGLLFDLKKSIPEYISLENAFPSLEGRKFDIIITNPPYKNLKAEDKGDSGERHSINKATYKRIKQLAAEYTPLSNYGVLNIYKLFVEEILKNYATENAAVGLLIPSSFLRDKSCSKIRHYALTNHSVRLVDILPENNPYLNAQQSVCTLVLKAFSKTSSIKICSDFKISKQEYTTISIDSVLNDTTENAIFALSDHENRIFNRLSTFPKIKDLPFIKNLRGELDLTANKDAILTEKTPYALVRGRDISYFVYHSDAVINYVSPDFVEKSTKREYIFRSRIACQQIANLQKDRRVSYTVVPEGCILGNSCNFISVDENSEGITLYFLLGVLNSNIINWYFKQLSTNNHVNNYEVDTFPIPVNSHFKVQIAELAERYTHHKNDDDLAELNRMVNSSFQIETIEQKQVSVSDKLTTSYISDIRQIVPGISIDDAEGLLIRNEIIEFTVSKYIGWPDNMSRKALISLTEKYKKLLNNEVLNHTTFKLSEMDMEMVISIPQGGSWKNIPDTTAAKSQRLMRIRETGGRTTLYGRIDYSKPSYTISTYFNRPGNGTYIHPVHNRVISVREAARLQSFPDNFYFVGNKTELLKQVGNAVPPMLAFHIGQKIKSLLSIDKCIDLFCGAGGLSLGLEFAGIRTDLAIDNNSAACTTFKTNMPWAKVLCADITKDSVKSLIAESAKANKIDFLCGGPPCQGFSLAGKRFIEDPRNVLFKHFIDVARTTKPKVIMFENVEGLLSYQGGEIYQEILDVFSSLGYKTEGRTLFANDYGVPQRRKRVIIMCVRIDLSVNPSELFPEQVSAVAITTRDAIGDLESITCSENAKRTDSSIYSDYLKELNALAGYSL